MGIAAGGGGLPAATGNLERDGGGGGDEVRRKGWGQDSRGGLDCQVGPGLWEIGRAHV